MSLTTHRTTRKRKLKSSSIEVPRIEPRRILPTGLLGYSVTGLLGGCVWGTAVPCRIRRVRSGAAGPYQVVSCRARLRRAAPAGSGWQPSNPATSYAPPMHFETKAVHAGGIPDEATGAVSQPLHLSTTFERNASDGQPSHGYSYIRDHNPTQTRLESALAAIDSADGALAFASGMAA